MAPPLPQVTASFQTPCPVQNHTWQDTGKTFPGGREGQGAGRLPRDPVEARPVSLADPLLPMTLQKGQGQLQGRLRLQTKAHAAWRGADRPRAPQPISLFAFVARKQSHVSARPFPSESGCLNAPSGAGAFRNEVTDREASSKVERKPSPDLRVRQGLARAVLMD